MRTPPSHADVVAHLRRAFGPETLRSEAVLRWWVHGNAPDNGVAIWLKTAPPDAGECCEVWVTRPAESEPERCPVTGLGHLDEFVARVKRATRARAAIPVHGSVCPPSKPAVA
jgi:hypothetical protein